MSGGHPRGQRRRPQRLETGGPPWHQLGSWEEEIGGSSLGGGGGRRSIWESRAAPLGGPGPGAGGGEQEPTGRGGGLRQVALRDGPALPASSLGWVLSPPELRPLHLRRQQ